jgi:hypothetical protein
MKKAGSSTAVAATAVLAATLTGCGLVPGTGSDGRHGESSHPPEASPLPTGKNKPPKGGLPDPDKVENTADAVGRAGLTAMWTIDTKNDVTQHDATLRATPYMTPKYAKQVRKTPQRAAPGAEWSEWTDHRAYTTAKLHAADEAGAPKGTRNSAYRTWNVTVTPHGRDRWKGKATTTTAFVHLVRRDGKWKIDTVQIR